MVAKAFTTVLLLALGVTACSAFLAAPLVGYQQGLSLQIAPSSSGGQCMVSGIPTASGYAPQAQTPLFLNTPQNTGSHALQFTYDQSQYSISPLLAPGQTSLQIDASNPSNPVITFDSNASPVGQSGAITIYLSDNTGAIVCSSQIQLSNDASLSCLPTYGGSYSSSGNGLPASAGNFVVPSGSTYAPVFVSQTIIQQYITINNININTVVINNIVPTPNGPTPSPSPTSPPPPAPAPTQPAPGPCPMYFIPAPLDGHCVPCKMSDPTCNPNIKTPTPSPTQTSSPTPTQTSTATPTKPATPSPTITTGPTIPATPSPTVTTGPTIPATPSPTVTTGPTIVPVTPVSSTTPAQTKTAMPTQTAVSSQTTQAPSQTAAASQGRRMLL